MLSSAEPGSLKQPYSYALYFFYGGDIKSSFMVVLRKIESHARKNTSQKVLQCKCKTIAMALQNCFDGG